MPEWRNGRRRGLKIPRLRRRESSSLSSGTKLRFRAFPERPESPEKATKKRRKEGTHVTINERQLLVDVPVPTLTKILHVLAWIGILTGTAVWGYGDLLF